MLRFRPAFLLASGALLGACGGDPPPDAAPAEAPATANRIVNDFTAAVPMGAGTAAARLHFQLQDRPVVGAPITVKYRIAPSSPVHKVQVVFEAEPGIRFVDELRATLFVEGQAATAAAETHELQVIAESPGVVLLKANVLTEADGASKSTDFAIPLIVSEAPPPAANPGS